MALNSMYENLMRLPLFNGVSYNRISEIVGNTRLAFMKFLPGERIVSAGPSNPLLWSRRISSSDATPSFPLR